MAITSLHPISADHAARNLSEDSRFKRAPTAYIASIARSRVVQSMQARGPEPLEALMQGNDPGDSNAECELDKMWHGVHFLLTDSVWAGRAPLDFLLMRGRAIVEPGSWASRFNWLFNWLLRFSWFVRLSLAIDMFSLRVFTAKEVKEIDRALAAIHAESIQLRFDAHKMGAKNIYPGFWATRYVDVALKSACRRLLSKTPSERSARSTDVLRRLYRFNTDNPNTARFE